MAEHNPRMALLTAAPVMLTRGATLDVASLRATRAEPEGIYAELPALLPGYQVLFQHPTSPAMPIAFVLLLDEFLEDRIEAARRLWRAVDQGSTVKPPKLKAQRLPRLKLVLRALDANIAGVGYRDIALAMFGDRVPSDAAWRTHSLRSSTIRLVQDGRRLMRGGYLKLLHTDRRQREACA